MQNAPDIDDSEIVRRVRAGEVDAFEHLLTKYREHVLLIVGRHLPYDQVEETAHEAFVRAFRSLANYKDENGFRKWLSTIAVRTCHDFWRRKYRSRELPMSSLSEAHQDWLQQVVSEDSSRALDERGRQREAKEVLDWALGKLSASDRMVLELVHLEGLTGKEAAEMLGMSVTNVKIRSFRARRKLKKLLAGMVSEQGEVL